MPPHSKSDSTFLRCATVLARCGWAVRRCGGLHHPKASTAKAARYALADTLIPPSSGSVPGRLRGDSISDQAIYNTLVEYALLLGVKLAPHDMRRTFAQLARKSHAGIDQIQMTLGHASIQTTEKYLGTSQDLQDAPSDRVKLRIHS